MMQSGKQGNITKQLNYEFKVVYALLAILVFISSIQPSQALAENRSLPDWIFMLFELWHISKYNCS